MCFTDLHSWLYSSCEVQPSHILCDRRQNFCNCYSGSTCRTWSLLHCHCGHTRWKCCWWVGTPYGHTYSVLCIRMCICSICMDVYSSCLVGSPVCALYTASTHVIKVSIGALNECSVNSNGVWHARLHHSNTIITRVIAVCTVWIGPETLKQLFMFKLNLYALEHTFRSPLNVECKL